MCAAVFTLIDREEDHGYNKFVLLDWNEGQHARARSWVVFAGDGVRVPAEEEKIDNHGKTWG